MAANRKEIVQRINEAFAENSLEKVLSFCTDDFTWTMVGDTTVQGKDPIRKMDGLDESAAATVHHSTDRCRRLAADLRPQRFVAVQDPNPSPQPGYSAKTTTPSAVVFDLKKPWI
jgi:hypothetical protein